MIETISVMVAVFVGYALGVRHTKRAVSDALDQLKHPTKEKK